MSRDGHHLLTSNNADAADSEDECRGGGDRPCERRALLEPPPAAAMDLTPQSPPAPQKRDDRANSGTDSVPNGSSVNLHIDASQPGDRAGSDVSNFDYCLLNANAPPWHPDYLTPPKMCHPLEESVLRAIGKGCAYYVLGFFVGVPLFCALLACALVVVPLRVAFYLVTRLTCRGLYRQVLRRRHCDPWWPMELTAVKRPDGSTPVSVIQCVATVHGGLQTSEIQQAMWKKLVRLQDSGGYLKYPKFSQTIAADCCSGFYRTWAVDERFDVARHVRILGETARTTNETTENENENAGTAKAECSGGIATLADLETELNRTLGRQFSVDGDRPMWTVDVVPSFGESKCTLVLLRVHTLMADGLCVPRIFCLLNDGALSFDAEPKLRGGALPPYNLFATVSYALWTWCQALTAGPLRMAILAWRGPQNVWAAASAAPKRYGAKTTVRPSSWSEKGAEPKSRLSSSLCSSSVQDPPRAPSFTTTLEKGGEVQNGGEPPLKRVTWARVPNVDQIMRAERILRATTLELLLAFVGGAFRRHFRSQGIRNPPDLQMSLPVSRREFMPIAKHQPCRFLLVPVKLPVSVEGCIPRVWEVQRQVGEALEGPYPQACKAATAFADLLLPTSWSRRALLRTHGASGCVLNFVRCSGELALGSRKVHSMLLYQPVADSVRAGFTFVQSGHEMLVSLSVDRRSFGDPDRLLTCFQAELQSLLKQLAVRMLTLSQATYLPSPIMAQIAQAAAARSAAANQQKAAQMAPKTAPAAAAARAAAERNNNDQRDGKRTLLASQLREGLATTTADVTVEVDPTISEGSAVALEEADGGVLFEEDEMTGEESLEELERLLATVQQEIDQMRRHPRGSRQDCIAKLAELERKMELFHQTITHRHSGDMTGEEFLEELLHLLVIVQQEVNQMRWHPRGSRQDCIAKLAELERKMELFHQTITHGFVVGIWLYYVFV